MEEIVEYLHDCLLEIEDTYSPEKQILQGTSCTVKLRYQTNSSIKIYTEIINSKSLKTRMYIKNITFSYLYLSEGSLEIEFHIKNAISN